MSESMLDKILFEIFFWASIVFGFGYGTGWRQASKLYQKALEELKHR